MSPQPDCCQHPTLRSVEVVDEVTVGQIVLKRCEACQAYWLVAQVCMGLSNGDVELQSLERVTQEEVADVLQMAHAS